MIPVGLMVLGAWTTVAPAAESLPGPVGARVLRVLDGDTIEVRAHIWLGQEVATHVRLAGVDAPELKGACRSERALAIRARAYLAARLATADGSLAYVNLSDIRVGKYGGRVLARVRTAGGEDLSHALLAAGLARPYAGKARRSWCTGAG
jgi:endonuclease YncB( thermonuclease family)